MFRRAGISTTLIIVAMLPLSACATARMHTQAEINGVTQSCGLALGELFQDESEKSLLFMIRHGATAEERACVLRWARERHLRLVFVNAEGLAS
jgi:hypothetical protein